MNRVRAPRQHILFPFSISYRAAGSFGAMVLAGVLCVAAIRAQDEIDPVLRYYWQKSGDAFAKAAAAASERRYVLTSQTFYYTFSRDGSPTRIDTLEADHFFTGSHLDSTITLRYTGDKPRWPDFTVPALFDQPYLISLFPNDTGGIELGIGLDADSAHRDLPTGLVIIDRQRYLPRWLYLHYPQADDGDRRSRSFRFALRDGLLLPDSLWEVGRVESWFFTRHYRTETGVTAYRSLP